MASTPPIITKLRAIDNGSWDGGIADFSSNALETARSWAIKNDPNILVLIEDELAFRAS